MKTWQSSFMDLWEACSTYWLTFRVITFLREMRWNHCGFILFFFFPISRLPNIRQKITYASFLIIPIQLVCFTVYNQGETRGIQKHDDFKVHYWTWMIPRYTDTHNYWDTHLILIHDFLPFIHPLFTHSYLSWPHHEGGNSLTIDHHFPNRSFKISSRTSRHSQDVYSRYNLLRGLLCVRHVSVLRSTTPLQNASELYS